MAVHPVHLYCRSSHVVQLVTLKDHDYVLKENKVYREEALKEKDYVTVSCQTDIDLQKMDDVTKTLSMLRADNKTIRNEFSDKWEVKRKLSMNHVLKNDRSMKFFREFPTMACIMPSSIKSGYLQMPVSE